jgi:hypothetical protein
VPQGLDRVRQAAKARKKERFTALPHHVSVDLRLGQVVRGYFAYHAVPTNAASPSAFRSHVVDLWRRALRRRSRKDRITWDRIARLAADFLPAPRILDPWPGARFDVTHPRWEPGARIAPAGICAGGVP